MSNDWNWQSETMGGSVVIPRVLATAVYTNQAGEIVIRQQSGFQEEDAVIILPRSAINNLIEALKAESALDPTQEQ